MLIFLDLCGLMFERGILMNFMDIIGKFSRNNVTSTKYEWKCFGNDVNLMEVMSSTGTESTISNVVIISDNINNDVYQFEAHDFVNDRSYRWTNPKFIDAFEQECIDRGTDKKNAYDDVFFIDLEIEADILNKAIAISKGEEYDTRVMIEFDIDDDLLLFAMKSAHELDITLNEFMEQILTKYIDDNRKE